MVMVLWCIDCFIELKVLVVVCISRVMLYRVSVMMMLIGLRIFVLRMSGKRMNSGREGRV